jgi:hypothetical protein
VVVPKLRTFGRSVLAGPAVVQKFQTFGRSVLVADLKARTFDLSAPVVPVRVPKAQTLDLNGPRLLHRRQVAQHLLLHKDPAMRVARAADIVISLPRVRNPAMRLGQAVGIGTRRMRVRISRHGNRSRRRDLGRPGRGMAERSRLRDKATRASAIARRREGDLGRSERRTRYRYTARPLRAATRQRFLEREKVAPGKPLLQRTA